MQALWNNKVIAESDDTVVVEGNHYFPMQATKPDYLEQSDHTSVCPWKGKAHYYHVVVDGVRNDNAAWYYPSPSDKAKNIQDHVAFWNGVTVQS